MGNQLLKGYTLQGEPISGVGCERMWRVYQGHKQNTNTMATIFAIEKKSLAKNQREDLIAFAKKQAMGLARIRHPGVLAISETLIQDENIMAFSTEQVLGNLSMLASQNRLKQIVSSQIQLRLSLFPLLDTIQFLHDNVKTVHLGINFDNVYITRQGKWKISGLSNSHIYGGEGLEPLKSFRCTNYYYCGPQITNQKKFQKRSDVYSLGVLILDLLLVLAGKYQQKSYRSQAEYNQNFQKDLMKKISNQALEKAQNYRELKVLLKSIFARDPLKRSSLHELSSSKWLNDKLVLTVRYLQNITNYDNKQQVQFLKGLMGILNHFDSKILTRKVLPLLLDLLKFKHLIPSVIYICLQIMKNGKIISESEFKQKVWPSLRKVMQGKQMTAHSLFLFIDNMQKIQKVVGIQQLTVCVIPLYVKCFDCPAKLKQLALVKTDYILSKMDYQFVKAKMIPKVMSCMKDQSLQIHKKSLIALRKSIKILDTQTITSLVLPGLQMSKKVGGDPFVNAITVSIYTMLGKTLPSEMLSSKLIPTILPYLSDPNVGPQDFFQYKNALLTMLDKIQAERKKFWDETQITQGQAYTEKDFQFEDQSKKSTAAQSNLGKGDYNFLSNYNSNPQQNQQQQQQSSLKKKQSDDFNFSTPFSLQQQPKNKAPPQPQPQYAYNSLFKPNPPSFDLQPQQQPIAKQTPINPSFNLEANFGMNFNNNNINNNININSNNQPISPENKMPRLKGPAQMQAMKGISKPPPPHNDPWASISLTQTPSCNNLGGYQMNTNNSSMGSSNNIGNMNMNVNKNNNFNMNSLNFGDDPFAQLQQNSMNIKMDTLQTGGLYSFSAGNNLYGGSNNNYNINSNNSLGNMNMNGFGNYSMNTNNNMNLNTSNMNLSMNSPNTTTNTNTNSASSPFNDLL